MHTAVDKDVLDGVVAAEGVVEALDDDSETPHDAGGDEEDENGTLQIRGVDDWGEASVDFYLMEEADDDGGSSVGVGYAMKVDKAGVTHDTVGGVEEDAGDDVRKGAKGDARGDGPEAFNEGHSAMAEVAREVAGESYGAAVDSEDAPVGECSTGEVPVAECAYRIHVCAYCVV